MYIDGQVLGASITATGTATVAALPMTAGNSVFQTILFATAAVATIVLIVRIVRLYMASRAR